MNALNMIQNTNNMSDVLYLQHHAFVPGNNSNHIIKILKDSEIYLPRQVNYQKYSILRNFFGWSIL